MTRKFPLISIAGSKTTGRRLVINLTRYAGASAYLDRDAKNRRYVVLVLWLSLDGKTLRYWYPSFALPFTAKAEG